MTLKSTFPTGSVPAARFYLALALVAGTLLAASGVADAVSPLPFDMPSKQTLRQSPKKVFAHYFPPFPISLDNKLPWQDYYATHYLNPDGEGGKYQYAGAYLRERPLPQLPLLDSAWQLRNLETEVRRAIAIGLDGFTVDLLSLTGPNWDRVVLLLRAAANVDGGFKIVLMPDMDAVFRQKPEALTDAITRLSKYPAAYRLKDGRLVVAPFNAQRQSATWWQTWLQLMRTKSDPVNVAFLPLFQGWQDYAADFQSFSYGYSDWGWHAALANLEPQWLNAAVNAHQFVGVWMAPVTPQDLRPKSLKYWEAANSLNYRTMWRNAIAGDADWVHVITWNDYSEHTEIAPSSGTQYSFYDLTAYYVTWFKTGQPPPIRRDVLSYFHRSHSTDAQANTAYQTGGNFQWMRMGPTDARFDDIEVLAFLTQPGTVEIKVGGAVISQDAPAGISSIRAPLADGTPQFRLLRQGAPVMDFSSATTISNDIVYQDLLYRGGGSSR